MSSWTHNLDLPFEIDLPDQGINFSSLYRLQCSYQDAECEVLYDGNDEGYPGAPGYWDWEIVDILDDCLGKEQKIKILNVLNEQSLDEMSEKINTYIDL